jgi:hypothetical protein
MEQRIVGLGRGAIVNVISEMAKIVSYIYSVNVCPINTLYEGVHKNVFLFIYFLLIFKQTHVCVCLCT